MAAGILFALSFIATPVKFLAANLRTAELLAVGRVTFRASLLVELILLAVLLILARRRMRYALCVVATILALQWLALMPLLDARTLATMAGNAPPPSFLHLYWIIADLLRLALYLILATLSFREALRLE
ncbi:MAG: hypothetical protein P1U62_09130 [Alteraurantiacibacter sp. bin_em_oilr2.035]|nr:hypothetical protein [Alteraurantiacibacter sp. bin_em_oilr2.035]